MSDSKSMGQQLESCLALITVGFIAFIGLIVLRGLVIQSFWAWFIVSLWPDAPYLSIPAAIGLGLTVRYIAGVSVEYEEDEERDAKQIEKYGRVGVVLRPILVVFIVWGLGWALSWFI